MACSNTSGASISRSNCGVSGWSRKKSKRACWLSQASPAVVLVRDAQLIGYYTADAELDEQTVKIALAAELPEYMVPALLMRLDAMPLSPSGSSTGVPCQSQYGKPANTSNRTPLAAANRRDLARGAGLPRIGLRDDFSHWAGTRCWPRKSSLAPARLVTSNCRCAPCSKPASWAILPSRSG